MMMQNRLTPLLEAINRAQNFAERFALDIAEAHRQSFIRRFAQQHNVPVPDRREEWLPYELAILIDDYNNALEKFRLELLQAEWLTPQVKALDPNEPLEPQIEQVIARHTEILARRIYSMAERRRQQSEGVTHYIWHTQGDDRVRPSHAVNHGQTFRWNAPPATGHPGTAPRCRCSAEAIPDSNSGRVEPVFPIESLILLGGGVLQVAKRVLEEILKRRAERAKNKPAKTKTEVAQSIANGHAWEKHVILKGDFPEIKTKEEFKKHIEDVINNPSASKKLEDGRKIHWQEEAGTFVVINHNDPDGGSAFKPTRGKGYYDDEVKRAEKR